MAATDTPEYIVVKAHFADIVDLLAGNPPVITQFSNRLFSSGLIPGVVHLNPKTSPLDRATQLINSVHSTIGTHSDPNSVFCGLVTSLQKVGLTDIAKKLQQSLEGRSHSQALVPPVAAVAQSPTVIQLSSKKEVAQNIDSLHSQFTKLAQNLRTRFEELISEGTIKLIQVVRQAAEYLRRPVKSLQANDIDELFDSLQPHYDFLNCSLLKNLTTEFLASDVLQLSILQYIDSMDKLLESSQLKHIRSIIKEKLSFLPAPTTKEHAALIVFKLHDRWEETTLKNFKRVLSHYFGSDADLFSHIHFDYGSLVVKMLIPTSILQFVTNRLTANKDSMNRIGIFEVAINGKTMLSIDDTDIDFEKSLMDSRDDFEAAMLLKLGANSCNEDNIDPLDDEIKLPLTQGSVTVSRPTTLTIPNRTTQCLILVYILIPAISILCKEHLVAESHVGGSIGELVGTIVLHKRRSISIRHFVGITGIFVIFVWAIVYNFHFTQSILIFLGAIIGAVSTILLKGVRQDCSGVGHVDFSRTCFAVVIGVMIGVIIGANFESIGSTRPMYGFFIHTCLRLAAPIMWILFIADYVTIIRRYKYMKKQIVEFQYHYPVEAVGYDLKNSELVCPKLHYPNDTRIYRLLYVNEVTQRAWAEKLRVAFVGTFAAGHI